MTGDAGIVLIMVSCDTLFMLLIFLIFSAVKVVWRLLMSYTTAYSEGVSDGLRAYFWGVNFIFHFKFCVMGAKEVGEFFDLLLVSPGLDATMKLDSRITCRTALFLVMALEDAMAGGEAGSRLKKMLLPEDQEVFKELMEEVLAKAKLKAFYERLRKMG